MISGASYSTFQIPNNPNQVPLGDFGPANLQFGELNENEYDTFIVQYRGVADEGRPDATASFAVYSRYAKCTSFPISSAISCSTTSLPKSPAKLPLRHPVRHLLRLNDRHTLRAGFAVSAEQTNVTNVSTVLPVDPDHRRHFADPVCRYRREFAARMEHRDLHPGRMEAFQSAYPQPGPSLRSIVPVRRCQPAQPARRAWSRSRWTGTTIHGGYARYFTPPMQAQATQSNLALFTNTTNQPEVPLDDPVKPERSHYFDVGVDQTRACPASMSGFDAYYKMATDMIDDGQFGQAVVLTQFNWARGYSEGARIQGQVPERQLQGLCQFLLQHHQGHRRGVEPVSPRRRRIRLSPHSLALHRRHAAA